MDDVVLGLVALVAGAAFCFGGYLAFRVIIPIWGAFVGFGVGVGLVSALTGDAVLAKPVGWVVGIAVALLFSLFAYLYFQVAVILAMASVGFLLGSTVMVALGITWSWVIAVVAVAVGVVFGAVAMATDLPRVVLVVVTAIAGATAMVAGGMLLTGALEADGLDRATVTERIDDDWWWYVAELVLVVAGVIVQARRHAEHDVRGAWGAPPAASTDR